MNNPKRMNKQIIEEAAEWFVELSAGDVGLAERQRFDAWLRTSPEHVRIYLEMLPIWEDGALPKSTAELGPEALIARARSAGNVTTLEGAAPRESIASKASSVKSSRPRASLAIAASVLIALGVAGVLKWVQMAGTTYSTDIGEQRSVVLADGSTIDLNAVSRVRVRFTEQQRDVDLLEGQALFRVAKDPARPFVVRSADTRVRAVGTQFDVYRKKSGTTVTVLEGRVAVLSTRAQTSGASLATRSPPELRDREEGSPPQAAVSHTERGTPSPRKDEVFLSAGEQLIVAQDKELQPVHVNVSTATAWTQRRLVFDSSPLTEVAEEFNRYNNRQLVIADTQLADFLVSGVFSSTDPASLVRFLREQPGLQIEEGESQIQVSRL